MSKFAFLLGAAVLVCFADTPRPAMAISAQQFVSTAGAVENVRLACDEFGRCWEAGYSYSMPGPPPRYGYGPRSAYEAYGYEYGPRRSPSKWDQKGFCPPGQHKKGNC